ncbi:uncharacterized protein LOC134681372 [Mytilus trossulus]|uniref:uncharacterized protein LOC134681372 n=1 Tax=Mytilus trossulus TaxID=6551 RepID=UPI003006B174
MCDSAPEIPTNKSEMSDHQLEIDNIAVDQHHKDKDFFSQSAQKDQNLESDIDVINEEIKRKNERIIELELMLEEKQDWLNLKSQMVKKLEGELSHVQARHPEGFTFDDTGTSIVPKSLEQTLKDLEREEREETFRTKYMPVYHREIEVFRKRGKYPTNVPYFNEVSIATEFLKRKYLEAFGECFSFDYKKKYFPIKPNPSPRTHIRPSEASFIQQEDNREFLVSDHLGGEVELLPVVTEACDLEQFSESPTKPGIINNESAEICCQGGDSSPDMWRTRPILPRPKTPRPSYNKKPVERANVKELTNGNNLFNIYNNNKTNKTLPTEIFKECALKRSVSMDSVFVGDGTKMRPYFIWRMGDECVSLEKYINVYTRNPEELYEAVKNRGIEKEEEDSEENVLVLYALIKANITCIDKTKIKSNLRILDYFIREEEEKDKSALTQVHTENVGKTVIDFTLNDKRRDEKETIVLPPVQTGSFYEDTDGADKFDYENKPSTSFDIMFEKPKKRMSKPKLSSEKREIVNLIHDVTDQNIKSNEHREDIKHEEKENISFDIMFESPKEQMTKPKLTSGGRKAKFHLKHSINEKKDESHDNEQKEDATTADNQIAVENANGAYKEDHALKKHVSFDVFFESPNKQKPKPKMSFMKRRPKNETKNNIDDNELQKVEKHEKSPKVPSKTTDVKHSNGGYLGGKFTNGKLGGKLTNDVLIKRKDQNENRFRFSFLHQTSSIPSRIPVRVKRSNGQSTSLTRSNYERPQSNSVRRIPFSVFKVTNKKHKAKTTGSVAARSIPERKISVRRGTDLKINRTRNAKSPNDDSGVHRKRERGTKLPRITRARKSRIPVRIKGYVWNTNESEEKRKMDESRRLLAPLSRIPIPKDKIRRPSDCIIPRLDPNEHLPQISQSLSKREEQAKIRAVNRNLISPTPMTIGEKGERTCPESTSEFLQLPALPTQNAMVKTSHPVSTSGLIDHTQIHGRKDYLDENKIVSPSVMGTLPPIIGRSDTYVNRPLSASGFAKLPPIKSTNKTIEMDRPKSSARLTPLFTAFENTEHRPLSACGSPQLPPIIDGTTIEMRPTSSLSGYALLPPITSYKQGSAEDQEVPVEESRVETDLSPKRAE